MNEWEAALERAIARFDAREDEAALAELDPFVAALARGPAEDARSFAGALYLRGTILQQLGQLELAFDAHRECIERFVDSHHPVARRCVVQCLDGEVILDAVRQHPHLLARLPPAHHALRLPANIERARTIEADMADATEAQRDAAHEELRRLVLGDDERAGAEHDRARAVLRDHFDRGQRFGLYLRHVAIEATETRLDDLPFIGLSNGIDSRNDDSHDIPRLEVSNPWWTAVMEILVRRAASVVTG